MQIRMMYFLFVLLFWIDLVFSSHFNGGTITWQPLDSSDTTSPISIAITQTYSWVYAVVPCNQTAITAQIPIHTVYNNNDVVKCITSCTSGYGYTSVPIARYCTNFSPILGITNTQRTDIVQLSANASLSIAFTPASAAYWRPLKAVSSASTSTATWSVTSTINLNRRTDNGLINTAPIGNVISPIEIPLNSPQQITIPVIDANNDIIKCRWAKSTPINECMDVCPPASLPAGVVLSTNCTLYVTGTLNDSWYVAAIMVEDFINASSTTPLSAVPVQFLIHVVQPASCSILPRVTGLNVTNMACVGVQTTAQYTSTLYVDNYCGSSVTIVAVSVQSFPGMVTGPLTTISSSLYSMSLTWTPTTSQIGLQILCAIAQDSQNQQSLQFCLVFSVAVGGVGSCPGAPPETTVVTTIQTATTVAATTASATTKEALTTVRLITTSIAATNASVTTKEIGTTVSSITTMEISTKAQTSTNRIAETTENTISISNTLSVTESTSTTTRKVIPGSTLNLPLIIGLSLFGFLLALLCCCLYIYYLFWGAGKRDRQQKQTRDRLDPFKNGKYLLIDTLNRTSSVPKLSCTIESPIIKPLRSSYIDHSSRSSGTTNCRKPSIDCIFSNDTMPDNHVSVSHVNQAEILSEEINKRISTADVSPKIVPRINSVNVVRVQRISTAEKDNKVLSEPNTDIPHTRVTRTAITKEPRLRSTVSSEVDVINTASKSHQINNTSTIVKTDGNNQQKQNKKKTKPIRVIKLPRIKTGVSPNT